MARIHRRATARTGLKQPAPPKAGEGSEGALLVDKPAGPTSHDIVDEVRRHFRIRKVGHGGTLDPMATGLLVLLLGRATKLSNRFLGSDKEYVGTMRLGVSTDSFDAAGEITNERDPSGVTADQVRERMATFRGDIYQTPPMVSAAKVDGVPLHNLARKGKTVARKARVVHVFRFDLEYFAPPEVDFVVRCSKGTYVRALCHEIGEGLGCGAHLTLLRRVRSGSLHVKNASGFADILTWSRADLEQHVVSMRRFV